MLVIGSIYKRFGSERQCEVIKILVKPAGQSNEVTYRWLDNQAVITTTVHSFTHVFDFVEKPESRRIVHKFNEKPTLYTQDEAFYADQNKAGPANKMPRDKYNRELLALGGEKVQVDVYRVLAAFNVTDPALQHAAKKILCAGLRGHKDRVTDLEDIIDSVNKSLEMEKQK